MSTTPGNGSINITDLAGLSCSLNHLARIQQEVQNLLENELPGLNSSLSCSVSGTAVETHVSNYATWIHNLTSVQTDLQALYSYLTPIMAAAEGGMAALNC